MIAIFPNVCLWQRSYSQNWEVLTLKNCHSIEPPSHASTAYIRYCMAWPSFLFYCFVKIGATCENFLGKWFTAPPAAKYCPYAYASRQTGEKLQCLYESLKSNDFRKTAVLINI